MNAVTRTLMRPPRMLHAHPLDPPRQHAAAAGFGKMVAMGLFEVAEVLPPLIQAALTAGYSGNVDGLKSRLALTVRDNAAAWERRRDRAAWVIRRAIGPMFRNWADPAAIRAEAIRLNAASDSPLLPRDLSGLLNEEAAIAMRSRRRRTYG